LPFQWHSPGCEAASRFDTDVLQLSRVRLQLSAPFAVPDVLCERGLREYGGEELLRLGLGVEGSVLLAALGS